MTLTHADYSPADVHQRALSNRALDLVRLITVPLTVLLGTTIVAQASGGRDAGALAPLLLLVAGAVVVSRPWRVLPWPWLLTAAIVTLAALLSLPLGGSWRDGSVAAGCYVAAAGTFVAAAAWANTSNRRQVLAALICLSGGIQFAWAMVPWWGKGDPGDVMVGTYYWHNQFAAALLAPAVLGLALAAGGDRVGRAAGWICTPLCVAGVVFAASRAATAMLILALAVASVLVVRAAVRRRAALVRVAGLGVLTISVVLILPGPPLFSERAAPWITNLNRAGANALTTSGDDRLHYFAETFIVLKEHLFFGAGFGRFGSTARSLAPADWSVSALAHSGPLQALADGGLLLGIPVLFALLLLVWGLLKRLWPRRRGGIDTALVASAAVASLLLIAHSLIDFDWSYPTLCIIFAVTAAVALAPPTPATGLNDTPTTSEPATSEPATVDYRMIALSGVLVAGLLLASAVAWGQEFHINIS